MGFIWIVATGMVFSKRTMWTCNNFYSIPRFPFSIPIQILSMCHQVISLIITTHYNRTPIQGRSEAGRVATFSLNRASASVQTRAVLRSLS